MEQRLGCPFPKCYPKEYEVIDSPCTRRPGFAGFRLLNEHIWKYHSYRHKCQHCHKRFTTASYETIDKTKEAHIKACHPEARSRKSSSSFSSSRTSSSSSPEYKSTGKRRRHYRESSDESTEDGYDLENMTPEQDTSFKVWQDNERKHKRVDTKAKYQSLYECLFGITDGLPQNPYFDYVLTMYALNERLAALGLGTLQELEANAYGGGRSSSSPTSRSFAPTTQTAAYPTQMAPAAPGDHHIAATERMQNPYNALYGPYIDCIGDIDSGVGGEADDGVYGGLPGTHAPQHQASHPSYHTKRVRQPAASWSISSGPGSGYLSIESEAMPGTPVALPIDGPLFVFGTPSDPHAGLRPDYSGYGYGDGSMGKQYGSGKHPTFDLMGLDQIPEDYVSGWDHSAVLEDFSAI